MSRHRDDLQSVFEAALERGETIPRCSVARMTPTVRRAYWRALKRRQATRDARNEPRIRNRQRSA